MLTKELGNVSAASAPRWRDYYLSHDQSGTYAYLKKCLQVLTFLKGPNRWVIKCPQHMEQLPALYRTFPDATFVLTHRDPVGSIRSQLTMSTYAARMLRKTVDIQEALGYWPDRYERLLRACVRDRDMLPPQQTRYLFSRLDRKPRPDHQGDLPHRRYSADGPASRRIARLSR
jgi:hypothetical protein